MRLWKLNKVTGFWEVERVCNDNHQEWLNIYQNDAPNEIFKLSKNKPRKESK
jgi:hypothetical protein